MARIELFPKHILDTFYTAFKNIAPVRILMKIAEPKLLPPGLPSNVMTQPWLQQIQVLSKYLKVVNTENYYYCLPLFYYYFFLIPTEHKNVKAFVTHGGLMGIQESIYFGVPMVGIPLSGDQLVNVEMAAKRKIAIKTNLNEITEKKFTETLNEILKNSIYR